MEPLKNTLTESLSKSLKSRLFAAINSRHMTDEIARTMLGKFAHIERKEAISIIQGKLQQIGKSEYFNDIIDVISKYDQADVVGHLISSDNLLNGDDIINIKNGNIYDILGELKYTDDVDGQTYNLDRSMLNELAAINKQSHKNIGCGYFEILISLFLKNAIQPKSGDIEFRGVSGNTKLEIKSDDARLNNQSVELSFNGAEETLKRYIRNMLRNLDPSEDKKRFTNYIKNKNLLASQDNAKATYDILDELVRLTDSEKSVFDILTLALQDQYKSQGSYKDARDVLGNKYESIKNTVCPNDNFNSYEFARLMMAIQFRGYLRSDSWDYLILIGSPKGTNSKRTRGYGDFVVVTREEIENLDTFYNEHINVKTIGGKVTGSLRDNFCQIIYK